jgi:HKD family nuclease
VLIVQTQTSPAAIRNAVVDLMRPTTTQLWVASAYVTSAGTKILFDSLSQFLSPQAIENIPKTLITCFDYGLTQPKALREWKAMPNSVVRVAGKNLVEAGSLIPKRAFHPKVYAFGLPNNRANMLVGSANLTSRGFTINTEAAWNQSSVTQESLELAFKPIYEGTDDLTGPLLSAYVALRKAKPPPAALKSQTSSVPAPKAVIPGSLLSFRDAVENNGLQPENYEAFWIQAEQLQGGSGNQLELPRRAHRFFGFEFDNYDFPNKTTIGTPVLRAGSRSWTDRLLTWHGNNRMERINLPTNAQGGFTYENSAVMFRRLADGSFELIVSPWETDLARSWRQASMQKNLLFRVRPAADSRVVGLI